MKEWRRRIRGLGAMGLTWALGWAAIGGVFARLPDVDMDLPLPLFLAPLGFATGTLCSGFLVLFEGQGGLQRASMSRLSGWGAASGLLLSGLFTIGAALRGAAPWDEFLLFGPALSTAGALSGAGWLGLQRWAERREHRV
jgi:hypothetical protein